MKLGEILPDVLAFLTRDPDLSPRLPACWVLVCKHWQGVREVSVGLPVQGRHLLQLIKA